MFLQCAQFVNFMKILTFVALEKKEIPILCSLFLSMITYSIYTNGLTQFQACSSGKAHRIWAVKLATSRLPFYKYIGSCLCSLNVQTQRVLAFNYHSGMHQLYDDELQIMHIDCFQLCRRVSFPVICASEVAHKSQDAASLNYNLWNTKGFHLKAFAKWKV